MSAGPEEGRGPVERFDRVDRRRPGAVEEEGNLDG
jgi:hypothetical protein